MRSWRRNRNPSVRPLPRQDIPVKLASEWDTEQVGNLQVGMINDLLWRCCRRARIRMSRPRPCQKNDNAWVERNNWTHVRKVLGCGRHETTTMRELALLNQICGLLRLYRNFFQPQGLAVKGSLLRTRSLSKMAQPRPLQLPH